MGFLSVAPDVPPDGVVPPEVAPLGFLLDEVDVLETGGAVSSDDDASGVLTGVLVDVSVEVTAAVDEVVDDVLVDDTVDVVVVDEAAASELFCSSSSEFAPDVCW